MSITLMDAGALDMLAAYFANNDLILKLFANNRVPARLDTAAMYTEANGGDYAPRTLAKENWSIASVLGVPTAAYSASQAFDFSYAVPEGLIIYGYFVVKANGVFVFAERAAAPFAVPTSGTIYKVNPKFQLSKGIPV
jgi:hypothetical protein